MVSRFHGFARKPSNQRTPMKHVKHCEGVHKSSAIQLSGNKRYLLNSNLLGEKTLTIRFGFLHVLIVIFQTIQTNSCGKCWLKPGLTTEFQTGLGGRGPVQSWLSPWCRCFSSLAVDILEIEVSISDICKNQSKYVDICNFSPDLIKIHQRNIRISSIYHGYSVILDVGNIHEIHHLMFFRMTCHGWPPGNIPLRNDGSFVSALVRQSHGYH